MSACAYSSTEKKIEKIINFSDWYRSCYSNVENEEWTPISDMHAFEKGLQHELVKLTIKNKFEDFWSEANTTRLSVRIGAPNRLHILQCVISSNEIGSRRRCAAYMWVGPLFFSLHEIAFLSLQTIAPHLYALYARSPSSGRPMRATTAFRFDFSSWRLAPNRRQPFVACSFFFIVQFHFRHTKFHNNHRIN